MTSHADDVLSRARVATRLPARDLDRARRFYAEKLGLYPVDERPGGLLYRCAGVDFVVFRSTGASPGTFTQMAFEVDDIEGVVTELRRRGVVFEEVDARPPHPRGHRRHRGQLSEQGRASGAGRVVPGQRGQPAGHRPADPVRPSRSAPRRSAGLCRNAGSAGARPATTAPRTADGPRAERYGARQMLSKAMFSMRRRSRTASSSVTASPTAASTVTTASSSGSCGLGRPPGCPGWRRAR